MLKNEDGISNTKIEPRIILSYDTKGGKLSLGIGVSLPQHVHLESEIIWPVGLRVT